MAIFNEHVIVNSGRELLGRALAGEGKIIITRAAMGDGKPSKDIKELTSLVNEKIVANVADIFNDRGTVNLKVQITNAELETPFKTEEFGIFAKIEGDEQEVLYSYCTAVEADTIPSNNGDVFIEEHTVYIAFSSDAEADIYIKEGVVFLSVETANKNYVPTGLIVEGKLSNGRTSLKENYQYQADNGKWYHNIGGNRSWRAGNGIPDELLLEISYFDIHKRLNTKLPQGEVSEEYDTAKKIEDKIKKIINEKWKINTKYIGDTNTSTDFNSITANGTYYSSKYNALYTNGFLGANQRVYQEFKLIVIGENNDGAPVLKSQLVITRDDNIYLRSCTSWQAPWTWSEWEKIARMSDLTWGNIGGKPSSFPPSSHTHDDRYYTEAEINEKFKNFCPIPLGGVLTMWNETNPTSLYLGTTWELISAGKYIKTGDRALQTGGTNSIVLRKDNLPNIKLNTTTASASIAAHDHKLITGRNDTTSYHGTSNQYGFGHIGHGVSYKDPASSGWVQSGGGGTTGTFSLQTESLGNGNSITIQPEYITLKFWKRTS